jgi:hypothetical protein
MSRGLCILRIASMMRTVDYKSERALRTALETLADLETDYRAHIETLDGDFDALEPTRILSALTGRIGENVETWNKTWSELEAMDKEGLPLVASQVYVMIAALQSLPPDAKLAGFSADDTNAQVSVGLSLHCTLHHVGLSQQSIRLSTAHVLCFKTSPDVVERYMS